MTIKRKKSREEKDEKESRYLESRASYSMVILERALKIHGSGSSPNLIPTSKIRRRNRMEFL